MLGSSTKWAAGLLGGTSLVLGGVDATKINEVPIDIVATVASEEVKIKQIDNVVDATFPWKDQTGIKVSYDMGEPTLAEKLKDKRKKQVITETVTDFEGGFKVDILLNEEPDTNVFCYAIEGAENYDFFFQPPLTEQEKAEGASRPPEIEGSYAVYHKTLKNHVLGQENYATGKVMHIPRPQVWSMSDVDTKVWADMTYDNGSLCVTVPQDFLNGAKYPVRVDPTFGYTTAAASHQIIGNNNGDAGGVFENRAGLVATGVAGTLDSISAYVADWGYGVNSTSFKAFLNKTSDGTQVVAIARTGVDPSPPAWQVFAASSESITAQSYAISLLGDGSSMTSGKSVFIRYDSTAATTYLETQTYETPESPWTFPSSTSRSYSIYATYTASGGGGATSADDGIIWY